MSSISYYLQFLFHQIGYEGEKSQVASTLNGLCHATLILQRSTRDATRQNFTLLIEELLEEFRILVVNILDTALFETAILLFLTSTVGGVK